MEECAEVTQIASKCLRFGRNNYHPNDKDKKLNVTELERELTDLAAVRYMLADEGVLQIYSPNYDEMKPKISKVTKYMEVSKRYGIIK